MPKDTLLVYELAALTGGSAAAGTAAAKRPAPRTTNAARKRPAPRQGDQRRAGSAVGALRPAVARRAQRRALPDVASGGASVTSSPSTSIASPRRLVVSASGAR